MTSRVGGRSVRNQPPSPRGQRRPDPGSAGSVGTSSAGSVCAGALAIPDSLARRGAGLREACQGSQRSADSGRSVAVGSEEAGAAATRAPDDEAASPAPDDGAEEVAVTQAPDDDGADGAAVTRAPEGGAEDAGAGPQASDGGTDGHDPQLSPRGPGCQGNCSRHDGEGGPGSKGAVVEGACAPPLAERAPRALAPGGDAAPAAAAVTSSGLLELYPFRGACLGRGRGGVAGEQGGSPGTGWTGAGVGSLAGPQGGGSGSGWAEVAGGSASVPGVEAGL